MTRLSSTGSSDTIKPKSLLASSQTSAGKVATPSHIYLPGAPAGAGDAWGRRHEHLPDRFFVAPKDVYMPDLTAVSDCYLGKLGYSTCAECVDSATPFVFVPRPLFVEEVGLRILLEKRGVGVQMSREQYESGDWATAIEEAYERGRALKAERRAKGVDKQRQQDTRALAGQVLQWIGHRTGREIPSIS